MGENLHMVVKQKNKNKRRFVMKNLIGLLAFTFTLAAPAASALEIEIRPLDLQARAEVFGLQAGVDGKKLIVLTGEAAQTVANAAGQTFDVTKDVVILAGQEVEELWNQSINVVAHADEVVIVGATWLKDSAVNLVLNARDLGRLTWNFVGNLGGELVNGLTYAATHPVKVVGDIGEAVFDGIKWVVRGPGRLVCELAFICFR
jgi:hypothetical protein